jgi:hypothetical protein
MIVYILVAVCINQIGNVQTITPSVLAFKSAPLCLKNVEANYKVMAPSCNKQLSIACKERSLDK